MRKCIFICLILFFALPAKAQQGFYKVYSGNGYDRGEGVIQLQDSTYLVTGSSSSFMDAPAKALLLHLDKQGNHIWSKVYGGSETETGKRVFEVVNDGFIVAGTSNSGPSMNFDAYIFRTDLSGNLIWETRFDQGGWERIHDAYLLPDTSIIAVGETTNTSNSVSDIFMIRVAQDGSLIWKQQFGTAEIDCAYGVAKLSDTTFAIGGTYYISDSSHNKAYLSGFHIDGSQIWESYSGALGEYQLNDLVVADGFIRVGGERQTTLQSDKDTYIALFNLDGSFVNGQEYYNPNSNARVGCMVAYPATSLTKYFMSVQTIDPSFTFADDEDVYISRYNEYAEYDGYGYGYNGTKQDQVNQLSPTLDGRAVGVGYHTTIGLNTGGNALFVVKIKDDNFFPMGSVNPPIQNILYVDELSMELGLSCFPNPFSDKLTFNVGNQHATIELYTVSGQLVRTESVNGIQEMDVSHLIAGIYIAKIQLGTKLYQIKLLK